jgi:hypothetical protein
MDSYIGKPLHAQGLPLERSRGHLRAGQAWPSVRSANTMAIVGLPAGRW